MTIRNELVKGRQREKTMRRQSKRLFTSYKKRGEWVELLFMTVASGIGFNVAKPWERPTATMW